ncbi:VOC family protein [Euzebya tangerina]|uniref:VOC family protein n=1 Tax=Euzebya tangerina TaxID=591198 RepID=UPI000E31210E|nr:VOC family protein [Euzebya tangerina]
MPELDAIGIVASDIDATLAFYRLLGFDLPERADAPDGPDHIEATSISGVRLMIDAEAVITSFSDWEPPRGGGRRVALALVCADAAEVDAVHAAVVATGHASKVAPFDAPWGQRYATVLDPDDNPVDLFAPL